MARRPLPLRGAKVRRGALARWVRSAMHGRVAARALSACACPAAPSTGPGSRSVDTGALQSADRRRLCRVDTPVHFVSRASASVGDGRARGVCLSFEPCDRWEGERVYPEPGAGSVAVPIWGGARAQTRRARANCARQTADAFASGDDPPGSDCRALEIARHSQADGVGALWGWLRLSECACLRVKDVDFALSQLVVRSGKGSEIASRCCRSRSLNRCRRNCRMFDTSMMST